MIKTGRVKPEDIEKMIGKADLDDDGYILCNQIVHMFIYNLSLFFSNIDLKEFQKMISG